MDSTEPLIRSRAILRWLPAMILAIVMLGAGVVVARIGGPPVRAAVSIETTEIPVLSVRRSLDPLLRRSADARLVARLDEFVATQPDDTCLSVRTGGVDYAHRGDDRQAPASLQKLLTATAALIELGPDATFETQVLGPPVVDGVVGGDLYLRGGGDPILSTMPYVARERNQPQIASDLARLADAVVAQGITTVYGSVVGDESRYDAVRYHPVWPSRFLAQGQIGPLSALSVNDGFAYFPEETGVFGAAADPAGYAARVLTDLLRERGVVVGAEPVAGATPGDLAVVAAHTSPPLAEIVAQMLQESDNNTAELLLKELGSRVVGDGSFAGGQTAITEILGDAGLSMDDATVVDGSGLAVEDQVTCDLIVDVLEHGATAQVVDAGLAVAGRTGTLSRRWVGTDLEGRVRAKTGTLNHVTGLAGHAASADDGDVRFALIVNLPDDVFVDADIVAGQERLAEILTAHPDLPDVSSVRPGADGGK
ncbi:D-alanyl-D-alanine carboxypeptidase/D-alanyl-D-alanine endopeptidase [Actinospongicola halichondriae]|uniref:D-alanyl-D-alanine carboxypeptidase/D-alanyl-D-alanine endopeptidase n=1 Tax=Actinospongicola halichondriae TaxID=3236844 RepID=UPI003D457A49